MPIEFYCPGCGKLMRTPDDTAGRKGRCPNCGTKVQIPHATLANSGRADVDLAAAVEVSEAVLPAPRKIEFYCSSCGRQVRVVESAAGQRGKCPQCQAVVQIPTLPPSPDESP